MQVLSSRNLLNEDQHKQFQDKFIFSKKNISEINSSSIAMSNLDLNSNIENISPGKKIMISPTIFTNKKTKNINKNLGLKDLKIWKLLSNYHIAKKFICKKK